MGEDRFILDWREAYRRAHDTDIAPAILPKNGGWYVFLDGHGRKMRRKDIEKMTARLRARVAPTASPDTASVVSEDQRKDS